MSITEKQSLPVHLAKRYDRQDYDLAMPQSVKEFPAIPPSVLVTATPPTTVAPSASRGTPSTPFISVVASPFRSVPVVGSLVPSDGGHPDGI